jgi:hypothetical protein
MWHWTAWESEELPAWGLRVFRCHSQGLPYSNKKHTGTMFVRAWARCGLLNEETISGLVQSVPYQHQLAPAWVDDVVGAHSFNAS